MKKIILVLCFTLTFISSCIASPLDHMLSKMTKFERTSSEPSRDPDEEGYTDFSGVWVGTCDDDPDRTDTFNIKMSDSSMIMNDEHYDIDAINTKSNKSNLNVGEIITHLRWNEDGSQLLATILYYSLSGYMATAKMSTFIGKMTLSMENNKLVIRFSQEAYEDAIHKEELDTKTTCIYNRKSN